MKYRIRIALVAFALGFAVATYWPRTVSHSVTTEEQGLIDLHRDTKLTSI